jgi:nicotinate-nucleotide adenylyltransferase
MEKKFRVGLYFGSFNPVHVGHLIIAESFLNEAQLNQVWLVVSPQNPLKEKKTLASEADRFQMVELATQNHPYIKPSNVEFLLPKPSYTIDTLVHLTIKFPNYEFSLLMGEDNLGTLHKWKNYEAILNNYDIYVYPRKDSSKPMVHSERIKRIQAPLIELSATEFRRLRAAKKHCRFMVPPAVYEYIDKNVLYVH